MWALPYARCSQPSFANAVVQADSRVSAVVCVARAVASQPAAAAVSLLRSAPGPLCGVDT